MMIAILSLLFGILFSISVISAMTSSVLRHDGSIIGKTPSDSGWDYRRTPAYKLGLTRLHVYMLWFTGLWGPYIVVKAIRNVPTLIIEGYASDKKALELKKREDLEERKKKIEKEYRKIIMEFDDWDEVEEKKSRDLSHVSYYDTL